ncbi:MAG TPA: DUF5916 domain-containing protein [Polyangiaceae bacterium LLY-WYZ-15_(1-7)]|nr:hypothetical protein [Myxococcales bacterium]MAT27101.1 hypothetical protein [Sandaracinus sp.]HJL00324.1 DUF5916 domain-containing protein [Polyangiaceae bacterium LLY-WYZ-15_(1-7)]HJL06876.1 DUF5916 domain-containing protein [Polyangiaceae bacterium LLY-WYZ-15_(1-7)]HJL26664.1 DUF5916 domain-containing protein [Polyangiaceae bacterium LLY-WYZ-15_(1-7)]
MRALAPLLFAPLVAAALAAAFTTPAVAQDAPRRTLEVRPRRAEPIRIDGRLDEPIWEEAEEATGFVERRPLTGQPAPARTRFRVLYDPEALYVGVVCELLPGETPRGVEMTRDDFRLFSDDAISLKFDVRHDRRNTVGFATNPAGAQLDYVAVDNGTSFRREFDAVWEVATSVREGAWVAEFRIPVAALGLAPTEGARVLGFNVTRDHNHRRATYDWNAIPLEFGATSALHYGELRGMEGMAGGRPLILIPYLLGAWREGDESRPPRGSPWTLGAGLDARVRLADDVWGELTTLTDFAQVDLDDPAVNLDRFPLFFPERRPFFLSGLDVFEFGLEAVAQPFFSRRIGLDEGRDEIPMLAGAKVYGRAPLSERTSLSFGVLNALTGGDLFGDAPLTNDSVARLRLNVGEASYVGGIATVHWVDGARTRPETTAGADFRLRAAEGQRLQIDGFFAGTFAERAAEPEDEMAPPPPLESVRSAAGQLAVRWRGAAFRPSASLLWVDAEFDPAVGFVRRRGVAQANATIQYQHRTSTYGLEAVDLYLRGTQELEQDLSGSLGRNVNAELALGWVAGGYLYLRADWDEKVVREAFEVAGREVPAGVYRGPRVFAGFSRPDTVNPAFSIDYFGEGSYFGGVQQTVSGTFSAYASRFFRFALSGAGSFVRLPNEEPFVAATGAASFTVAPTTTLQMDGVFQINNVAGSLVTLARLRWRYVPGSDLFVVYREQRPYGGGTVERERRLTVKLTYRYDALL